MGLFVGTGVGLFVGAGVGVGVGAGVGLFVGAGVGIGVGAGDTGAGVGFGVGAGLEEISPGGQTESSNVTVKDITGATSPNSIEMPVQVSYPNA